MKKYQVIGGQYFFCRYGESDSLRGAKQIAAKHKEYWDNWQGWHRPKIYLAEDCEQGEGNEYNFSGIHPKDGATAAAVYDERAKTWEYFYPMFGEI